MSYPDGTRPVILYLTENERRHLAYTARMAAYHPAVHPNMETSGPWVRTIASARWLELADILYRQASEQPDATL